MYGYARSLLLMTLAPFSYWIDYFDIDTRTIAYIRYEYKNRVIFCFVFLSFCIYSLYLTLSLMSHRPALPPHLADEEALTREEEYRIKKSKSV